MGDNFYSTQNDYEYIRLTFFPRWDRKRQWVFKMVNDLPCGGVCNYPTRTISLQPFSDKNIFYKTMIHEICHSCTKSNHGKNWQNRMLIAAKVASEKGLSDLSDMIIADVEMYQNACRDGHELFYETITDYVVENPDTTFDEMKKAIAGSLGIYPDGIDEFKRSKKVFEEAKKGRKQSPCLK